MNPDEKSKLLIELTRQLRESQQLILSLLQKIDKLTESQQAANEEIRSLREQLTNQNKLLARIASLEEELRLAKKHRFDPKRLSSGGKNERDNRAASK